MTTTMMTTTHRFVRFLASVMTEAEALIAVAGGADVIDCKNPSEGALGALPHEVVAAVRRAVPEHIPVSATIGDLPLDPGRISEAAGAMAATGCDIVKIGFFPGGDPQATLRRLKRDVSGRVQLVAVLLADAGIEKDLVPALAEAGFVGVMVDTALKDGRTLLDHGSPGELAAFIGAARRAGLLAGLAGSLRVHQIPELSRLGPDILGFRGALCRARDRRSEIDPAAVASVHAALDAARATLATADAQPLELTP